MSFTVTRSGRRGWLAAALMMLTCGAASAQQGPPPAERQLARDIFKEIIEIRSADYAGVAKVAEALARRFVAAGFAASDVQLMGPTTPPANLVVRLRSAAPTDKPVLLMAHLDVVDARRDDWSVDPFTFLERDGFYYGRGTTDNKAGVALLASTLIRLRKEGVAPSRDLIVALTSDEETTGDSIQWLLREKRSAIDAAYALNTDAGDGVLRDGKRVAFMLQTSEKVYQSFRLEVRNKGGHSSLPTSENAIYRLAAGLTRLASFSFPVRLNDTTRQFFGRSAALEAGVVAADMRAVAAATPDKAAAARLSETPYFNAMLHTTCVATRLDGGHADNALPQTAIAIVNCRILPGESPAEIHKTLQRAVADPAIVVTPIGDARPSEPSPLTSSVMTPIERVVEQRFPGATVIPEMSTGATDGLFVRNAGIPVYGVGGIFGDPNDVRAHGRDERVAVEAFHDAQEFWYALARALVKAK